MRSTQRGLHKAGVSEVIATILLISISLGLGFFLWAITSGLSLSITQFSARDTDAQIQQASTSITAGYITKGNSILAYLFNNGRVPVKIIGIDLIGSNDECITDSPQTWSCLGLPKDFNARTPDTSIGEWLDPGELSLPITITYTSGNPVAVTVHAVAQKIFQELDVSFIYSYEVTATFAV